MAALNRQDSLNNELDVLTSIYADEVQCSVSETDG